jgi:hypothetical protein
VYDGEWARDMREGKGTLRFSDGCLCKESHVTRHTSHVTHHPDDGEWSRDKWNGQGLLSLVDVRSCRLQLAFLLLILVGDREPRSSANGEVVLLGVKV